MGNKAQALHCHSCGNRKELSPENRHPDLCKSCTKKHYHGAKAPVPGQPLACPKCDGTAGAYWTVDQEAEERELVCMSCGATIVIVKQ